MDDTALLEEQRAYYRARAREYDSWWLREGRFDHGEQANARWFADVAALEEALERFGPSGDVLELACGTGLWTRHLVKHARRLVAVDASPEVLAINRGRVAEETVGRRAGDGGVRAGGPVRVGAAGRRVRRLLLRLLALARPREPLRRLLGHGARRPETGRARVLRRQRYAAICRARGTTSHPPTVRTR